MESKSEGKYDDDDVGAKGGGGGGCKGDGGGDAKGSSGGRGGALIREVFDYYCESKELEDAVREFVFANCRTFGEAGGEYELETGFNMGALWVHYRWQKTSVRG